MPFGPLIKRYKRHLFGQGRDRWQALPCALISIAQPHYPQIDLTRVRYADSVSTLHGGAIAWHYRVFFPWKVDLTRKTDLFVMLHELEHVVQYEVRGGEQAFLSEYIQKAITQATARGTWRVHANIDLEQAAQEKAKRIFADVFADYRRALSAANAQSPSTCRDLG